MSGWQELLYPGLQMSSPLNPGWLPLLGSSPSISLQPGCGIASSRSWEQSWCFVCDEAGSNPTASRTLVPWRLYKYFKSWDSHVSFGALKESRTGWNNSWANPYTRYPNEGSCTPSKVQLVGARRHPSQGRRPTEIGGWLPFSIASCRSECQKVLQGNADSVPSAFLSHIFPDFIYILPCISQMWEMDHGSSQQCVLVTPSFIPCLFAFLRNSFR